MKSLYILCLFFVALTAKAGAPDEDPVVAKMRTQFANAHMPSAQELTSMASWSCTYRSANRGNFQTVYGANIYQFSEISVDGVLEITNQNSGNLENGVPAYVYNSLGLYGAIPGLDAFAVIRIDAQKQLIVETTREDPYNSADAPQSIASSAVNHKATAYAICVGSSGN